MVGIVRRAVAANRIQVVDLVGVIRVWRGLKNRHRRYGFGTGDNRREKPAVLERRVTQVIGVVHADLARSRGRTSFHLESTKPPGVGDMPERLVLRTKRDDKASFAECDRLSRLSVVGAKPHHSGVVLTRHQRSTDLTTSLKPGGPGASSAMRMATAASSASITYGWT